MSEFGSRLRRLRRDADITQGQLAKVLNIDTSAVGKYERFHDAYPSIPTLIKIADYFHVSIDYLLRGIEDSSPTENNVSGELTNSTVIQANRDGTVFSNGRIISPEANELLHIYNKLGVRERVKLLNFAFGIEEEDKGNDRV